jgi:transcriptional regulator with XRE-family HTH domain
VIKAYGGTGVLIGQRLRQLREEKGLSQGDIARASGLLRPYISRVEHGHTVPSLETLERFAGALQVPPYRFFYTGEDPPPTPHLTPRPSLKDLADDEELSGADARFLLRLQAWVGRLAQSDKTLLLDFAQKLAARSGDR